MREVEKPAYDSEEVYLTCVNSIPDLGLKNRLTLIAEDVKAAADDYAEKAEASELFEILPVTLKNDEVVVDGVTKKELKDVYTLRMVRGTVVPRSIYDSILGLAPRRCPYCAIRNPSTLDHYLPKSKFPLLSVLPINLVPSCKECNTGKSSSIATVAKEQSLHPYFDQGQFITEQWLFARVRKTSPPSISFFVKPPRHWDNLSKRRVFSHFRAYKLAKYYSDAASEVISVVKETLTQHLDLYGNKGISNHLMIEHNSYRNKNQNSWETAMYQAMAESDWYCSGGFRGE